MIKLEIWKINYGDIDNSSIGGGGGTIITIQNNNDLVEMSFFVYLFFNHINLLILQVPLVNVPGAQNYSNSVQICVPDRAVRHAHVTLIQLSLGASAGTVCMALTRSSHMTGVI